MTTTQAQEIAMPSPSKSPRLVALDPAIVASETSWALLNYAQRLHALATHQRYGPLTSYQLNPEIELPPIFQYTAFLVTFAKSGGPLWLVSSEFENIDVGGILKLLAEAFYGSPGHGCSGLIGDQNTALGVAWLAATARLAIAAGEPVEPRALASLAGVHPSRVRALCTKLGGKKPVLQRSMKARGAAGWKITAASAKAWLRSIEVPGLEDRDEPRCPRGAHRTLDG